MSASLTGARAPDLRLGLGKILTSCLAACLALLHGQLLWQRVDSFTLLEPLVALRWGAAALILGGFAQLWRTGASVVRGRRALILWLAVLVLHACALPTSAPPLAEPGMLLALSLGSAALLFAGLGARVSAPLATRQVSTRRRSRIPGLAGGLEPLSPRPPPVGSFG